MRIAKKIIPLILFCFSLVPGYGVNVSSLPYGINVHQVENNILKKVADAGIQWIRTGAHWFAVETQDGVFDWTQVDRVVDYAHNNGLSILLMIGYTPGWANDNKGIDYPADNTADWENFVRITVNRYKSKVKYWNIWNEPNSGDFFAPGKDMFVEKVFLPAARAIRTADPAAFIVGPELAHLVSLDEEWYFWLKYILTECSGYIDIVSHHIYKNEGAFYIYDLLQDGEDFIPAVQQIIEETGHDSRPFWITETGWNSSQFSEQVQGNRYLDMLLEQKEKSYPDKIFFYEIIDDPAPGIDPWGILRSDLTEKPAYEVYKDFIAGKYPNGNGDGSGNGADDQKKKCYAEKVTAGRKAGARGQAFSLLSPLKDFRDGLMNLSPAARELAGLYYEYNETFLEISLRDSRIYRLGVELLQGANRWLRQNRGGFLNKTPDRDITAKIEVLTALLKEKELPASFKELVLWSERQIKFLETTTLGNYLLVHLPEEMRGFLRDNTRKPPSCLVSAER